MDCYIVLAFFLFVFSFMLIVSFLFFSDTVDFFFNCEVDKKEEKDNEEF